MMRQAAFTILARICITGMNLLLTMIAGHRLGAAGLGDISLIVLGIALVVLPAGVAGGGGLVYLAPRVNLGALLRPAYAWALAGCAAASLLMLVVPVVPMHRVGAVALLAVLQSMYTIHLNILLGFERIRAYNRITVAHALALLVAFLFLTSGPDPHDANDYVLAAFIAFSITVLLSTIALAGVRTARHAGRSTGVLHDLLKQGGMIQAANALQLLNYRLGYWLVEHFRGVASLGIYSVATQLAEGSWLAPRSLGTVLYSKVSNSRDREHQREVTVTTFKVSVLFAGAVLLMVQALPDPWVRALFGREIGGLAPIVLVLSPGILAMAASQAFSHYFSGTAANRHNLIGSALGLVLAALGGWLLIPHLGLQGAAGAASLAYCANAAYQGVVFMRITGTRATGLLPHAGDLERVRSLLRSIRP